MHLSFTLPLVFAFCKFTRPPFRSPWTELGNPKKLVDCKPAEPKGSGDTTVGGGREGGRELPAAGGMGGMGGLDVKIKPDPDGPGAGMGKSKSPPMNMRSQVRLHTPCLRFMPYYMSLLFLHPFILSVHLFIV